MKCFSLLVAFKVMLSVYLVNKFVEEGVSLSTAQDLSYLLSLLNVFHSLHGAEWMNEVRPKTYWGLTEFLQLLVTHNGCK